LRIRQSVLVAVLSLGIPAGLTGQPALAQASQPTAQELYESGMELYKTGELKKAQELLRQVDPLQLPREQQPTFYNTLFEIDQELNAPDQPDTPDAPDTPDTPDTEDPEVDQPELPEPEVEAPDNATLLRQADAMAQSNPAEALAVYQQVAASVDATDAQKATAQARIAGLERRLNGDITAARKLIVLAEADIVQGNLDAAEDKLNSVKNSGVELGFFDSESVNKKLALIGEVRQARADAAEAERLAKLEQEKADQPDQPGDEPVAEGEPTEEDKALAQALARAEEAEAKLAAMQRQLADQQDEQVAKGAPVSDLMIQARAKTAAEKVEQGDEALRKGQLNAAVQLYEDATLLDPDNETYAEKLTQARAQLNEQARPLDFLDKNAQDRRVDKQRAETEFESAMQQANEALNNKDFQAAKDAVDQARVILGQNKGLFDTADFNERSDRAARMASEIQQTQMRAKAAEIREAEIKQEKLEAEITRENEERREREIQNRAKRALELRKEQKYEEALAEIDAALFLDPNNAMLQGLKMAIEDASIIVESHNRFRKRNLEIAKQSLLNIEASTPYEDILTYPGDWPELTQMRLRGLDDNAGESEANRAAQAALRKIVTLSNENLSLNQVIAFIRDTTGANIAVNWPALEIVGITQESLVTISLSRVPAEQLLRLVLDQVSAEAFDDDKAGFTISEGIVKISTLRDLKSETETRVYDIRDLLVQVPNFNQAPGFDLNDALSNTNSGGSTGGSGGGGGGGGGGEGGLFGSDDGGQQEEELPSRQELVDQIRDLITTTVGDPDEWLDEESTLNELNGNMIIKTTGDNHRQITGLLGRLRETRAVQISVEARFLQVEKNFLDEFLIDMDLSIHSGDKGGPISVSTDSSTLIGRESTVVGSSPFTSETNNDAGTPGDPSDDTTDTVSNRGISIGANFLSDVDVSLLLNATQGSKKNIALTAPRITFFNGQRAYALVATQIAFVSDLEPIPDSLGFDPTISVITTGVVLDVEGTISSDRRYVTMTLRPSLASLIELENFEITSGGVDTGDGDDDFAINISGTIQVPRLQITQIRNTVSVPDRGTLLIGGQRLVGEVETEVGVPVLSKVPVINRLFTQNSTVQDESTLLILVRPTIIIQSEQEEILFPGLNDNPDDYNIGNFNP